jgi:hypothetical protein
MLFSDQQNARLRRVRRQGTLLGDFKMDEESS